MAKWRLSAAKIWKGMIFMTDTRCDAAYDRKSDGRYEPAVPERAVLLDCGRKYFTPAWICGFIREIASAGMNALVLHFSEEMGLGIESRKYPWLAGRDGTLCVSSEVKTDGRYLTQNEVRAVSEAAKACGVDLIPSFDSPGHMNYIVKKYNGHYGLRGEDGIGNFYHYKGRTAPVQGSRNTEHSRGIDISNQAALDFTRSLIAEYAELFAGLGCTKFDIGGDELLGWGESIDPSVPKWQQLDHWKKYAAERSQNSDAVAYDAFMYYMNDIYGLVSGLGYTSVRMWNDDALRSADTGWKGAVTLNKNIGILYWTPDANCSRNSVRTYICAGHKVYNYLNAYNYYVLGKAPYAKANREAILGGWSPYVFDPESSDPKSERNADRGNGAVAGSAFCIWCDDPEAETEETVLEKTMPLIRAHADKCRDPDRYF